eukprot:CAMPEP_0174271950 /NCGR_PEP_ID=MMETSP0439-20130205/49554_1 /TAXON_ID=0 /ORGANISM="Stereomyxa ramosa, Strain Chinc5" /LENGTH=64 /DNA_ID=CAMNT_0015362247 /DNA_START=25 /DNA_END=216 /DNA_ORIENTATION=+
MTRKTVSLTATNKTGRGLKGGTLQKARNTANVTTAGKNGALRNRHVLVASRTLHKRPNVPLVGV